MFVIFFVSALAETNRPPFDLVEAESELVAGFMVEYGSTLYMLFMLGEYVAICTMSAMATIFFMAAGCRRCPIRRSPGCRACLVRAQGAVLLLPDLHGQGHGSTLPLRSADAARLESVPAAVAGDGGDRCLLCSNTAVWRAGR